MLYSTLHYIIVQYNAVQYSTQSMQYSIVQYNALHYSTVQYSTVQKCIKTLIYKPEELNQILRHQCLYLMRFGNLCSEIELTLVLRLTADMCLVIKTRSQQHNTQYLLLHRIFKLEN